MLTHPRGAPAGGCGCAACCGAPATAGPSASRFTGVRVPAPRGRTVAARSGVLFHTASAEGRAPAVHAAPPPPGGRPYPRGQGTFLGQPITEQLAFEIANAASEVGCEERVPLAGGAVYLETVTREPPRSELLLPVWHERIARSNPVDGMLWLLVGKSASFSVFVLSDTAGLGRPHWCNQTRGTGELASVGLVARMDGAIEATLAPTAVMTELSIRVRLRSRCYGDTPTGVRVASSFEGPETEAEGSVSLRLGSTLLAGAGNSRLVATVRFEIKLRAGVRSRRYSEYQTVDIRSKSPCGALAAWAASISNILAGVLAVGMEGLNVWRSGTNLPGFVGGVQDVRGVCSPIYLERMAFTSGVGDFALVTDDMRTRVAESCNDYFGKPDNVGFDPPGDPPVVGGASP